MNDGGICFIEAPCSTKSHFTMVRKELYMSKIIEMLERQSKHGDLRAT